MHQMFTFSCINCGRSQFSLNLDVLLANSGLPVASFACQHCGTNTAVQKRPGGGLEISIDQHVASVRAPGATQ
jgi:transcription elongation factor Elf1